MAAENPSVWNDSQRLQQINQERSLLEKTISQWENFNRRIEEGELLFEMSVEEKR